MPHQPPFILEKTVSKIAQYKQIALHVREVTRWRW
jgi:hypothetical protein